MFLGIVLIFRPLVVLADVLPVLGSLLGLGVVFFAAVLAAPLSLVVIAMGWIFYRPVLGVILLLVAFGIITGGVVLARKRKRAAA